MAYCSKCGTELVTTSAFCGSCGTAIAAAEVKPSQQTASLNTPDQEIPEAWKLKFALLEKAGGPKLTKARELSFGERSKVVFNVWGFLFGPFYYLA